MSIISFKPRTARRMPDPVLPNVERHVFICAVEDVPAQLPKDSNPRAQNVDRRIYRDIEQHLLNEDGTPNTFHLKNKGITVLADKVVKLEDDRYEVSFSEGQGIVDGGHTYTLVLKNQDDIREVNANGGDIRQFIKFEILTGVEKALVTEIAGGLNTAVQVQQMSLANLSDKFEWIKSELSGEPYGNEIAFREGESAAYDVRDVLVFLDLFNIWDFPNAGTFSPVRAYSSKEAVLENYLKNPALYERLRPLMKDILQLHDIISSEAGELHNKLGGKAGHLAFMEGPRKRGKYRFVFIGKEGDWRLHRGALFPMLSAFRWMVEETATGEVRWRGGFTNVSALWRQVGGELMRATKETSDDQGRNVMAIGKKANHWATLHSRVAMRAMMNSQ